MTRNEIKFNTVSFNKAQENDNKPTSLVRKRWSKISKVSKILKGKHNNVFFGFFFPPRIYCPDISEFPQGKYCWKGQIPGKDICNQLRIKKPEKNGSS